MNKRVNVRFCGFEGIADFPPNMDYELDFSGSLCIMKQRIRPVSPNRVLAKEQSAINDLNLLKSHINVFITHMEQRIKISGGCDALYEKTFDEWVDLLSHAKTPSEPVSDEYIADIQLCSERFENISRLITSFKTSYEFHYDPQSGANSIFL